MTIQILMPALSPTMSEGNLARWLKKEGDAVKSGDVMCEIETDKATMEFEAVDEGVIGKILVAEGTQGVAVNTPIAVLLEEGEDASAADGAGQPEAQEPAAPAAAARGAAEGPIEAQQIKAAGPAPASDAKPANVAGAPGAGSNTGADISKGNGKAEEGRVFASPLARRMAEQAGLDLANLTGSGPHGRIVKADVEKAAAAPKPATAAAAPAKPAEAAKPAPAAAAPAPAAAAGPIAAPSAPHKEIQLNNMRKVIARRLTESKSTVPHFYLTVDVELDALLKLREELNGRPKADYKLSVNDFVIKAVAQGMKKIPGVNASWGGDKIYQFEDIDISVAVAIEGGLITPIIRKADQKGLSTISAEMKDLAKRAKEGKLKPEEFQGGGFSISNLGMYGVKDFAAVINPPQACILAIGAGEKRPVVKNDALAIATMMSVTLSTDHRVVDGALGAEFLQVFKKTVEDPLSLLL
ncbi:MAG TPA: pyruvate dehydrogenase complex dihydrolipoamide acetyltransferase [Geminicoccus sp.]|jgi:pyruvate dehydrogenase E2 component (dihydrolipoamide acetyltransferase)|uniref:pyruvate dehydrogenase complex dihydrolipoamide acetyltransferase n=1 Tax=Geminicoccus sp. TaxID=2024832 RepID=UPI002E3000A3|nr:pyruvate dehydrogenase complex dihydrolipoamide acetyltransferase [Geminicoccus sp.]HEX2527692.1 pyruvate dehydrogenase complex dihydrolipoamide acetyltransferase [Geminicoccus sp.]